MRCDAMRYILGGYAVKQLISTRSGCGTDATREVLYMGAIPGVDTDVLVGAYVPGWPTSGDSHSPKPLRLPPRE